MDPGSRTTGGFVLVDALVAVALLTATGAVIYTVGSDLLSREDRRLDSSMALMNLRAIAQEIVLVGVPPPGIVRKDDLYTYVVREAADEAASPALVALTIEALPHGDGEPLEIVFLAPVTQR